MEHKRDNEIDYDFFHKNPMHQKCIDCECVVPKFVIYC